MVVEVAFLVLIAITVIALVTLVGVATGSGPAEGGNWRRVVAVTLLIGDVGAWLTGGRAAKATNLGSAQIRSR